MPYFSGQTLLVSVTEREEIAPSMQIMISSADVHCSLSACMSDLFLVFWLFHCNIEPSDKGRKQQRATFSLANVIPMTQGCLSVD